MTDLPTQLTIPRDRAAIPASIASRLPSAEITGLFVAFAVWLMIVLLAQPFGRPWGTGMEAISYWANHLDAPYAHSDWTKPGAYVYSPAFLQLVAPLAALPWVVFMGVWTAIMLVAVRFLTGPRLFALGALLAVVELSGGNISLLLAGAMVIGFRYPAAWAFVILTKVTPGIGLLWFVVRREWHQLGIALGATAAVVAISFVIMPGAWLEWVEGPGAHRRAATAPGPPCRSRSSPGCRSPSRSSSGARARTAAGRSRSPGCSPCRPCGTAA